MVQRANSETGDLSPTRHEICDHLQKVLACADFDASERNKRFLSYVVSETLEGRGNRIKAYNIALGVFDREADFDPLTDPIVRIEAGRLRRSLELYYLTAGLADRIRIDIPKGSYAAAFSYAEQPDPKSEHALTPDGSDKLQEATPVPAQVQAPIAKSNETIHRRIGLAVAVIVLAIGAWLGIYTSWKSVETGDTSDASLRGPRIIVRPFEDISGTPTRSFVARALTYEVISNLTRFEDLFVYGPETSFELRGSTTKRLPTIDADYVLSGSVFPTSNSLRVSAVLLDSRSDRFIWSWSDERPLTPANLLQVQSEIAEQVVRAVAQPYGAVFERTAAEISGKPAKDLLSYECVVRFQQYWRTYDITQYNDLRACMETTIETDPGYARAYSSLALLYVDAYRFGYGAEQLTFDPIQRALELADTAISLEPMASDGYLALSVARWFAHNVEGSLEAANRGLALNPNNTILIGELGIRYALLARWDESEAMITKLFARNPRAPAGYRRANFFRAYMHRDYETALTEAMAAEMPLNIYDHVMRAMVHAQLGNRGKATEAVTEILKIDQNYGDHVAEDFAKRNADPSIVDAIGEGLTKAGLSTSQNSYAE
jgi:adenylate cyclase